MGGDGYGHGDKVVDAGNDGFAANSNHTHSYNHSHNRNSYGYSRSHYDSAVTVLRARLPVRVSINQSVKLKFGAIVI